MRIKKEFDAIGYGEYDFYFYNEDNAVLAARKLANERFMVGGGNDKTRICIATDTGYRSNINEARDIIELI